jgi:hypothetical protein
MEADIVASSLRLGGRVRVQVYHGVGRVQAQRGVGRVQDQYVITYYYKKKNHTVDLKDKIRNYYYCYYLCHKYYRFYYT